MATLDQCIAAGPDADAAFLRLERLRDAGIMLPSDGTAVTRLAAVLASGDNLPNLLLAQPDRLSRLLADPWLARPKPSEVFAQELRAVCGGAKTFPELQRVLRRYSHGDNNARLRWLHQHHQCRLRLH